jgi:hypothetical protein
LSGSNQLPKGIQYSCIVATEIEFYLHGSDQKFEPAEILKIIEDESAKAGIKLAAVEQERGLNQ